MAIYDRNKAAFFTTSGGVVAPDRLTNEVEEQILSPSLTSITDGPADAPDVCRFDFAGTLSEEQEATLDSVCNAHSGEPLPIPEATAGFVEHYYVGNEGNDSTTSGKLVTKVDLDETFEGGRYAIEWYYESWNGRIWRTTRTVVTLDDEEYLAAHDYRMMGKYTEDCGGGVRVVELTPGQHSIKIQFCRVDGGLAYIRRARILVRKVSD